MNHPDVAQKIQENLSRNRAFHPGRREVCRCVRITGSSQLRRQLKEGFLFFDGGYGTILAEAGLEPGERPELWNFRREDFIRDLHLEYLKAGCNLLKTNTFGGDIFHYAPELRQDKAFHERLIFQGVRLAREAIRIFEKEYNGESPNHAGHFIALDTGPTRLSAETGRKSGF